MTDLYDVAIIGGDPTGRTAIYLPAGAGRRVVLPERFTALYPRLPLIPSSPIPSPTATTCVS